jgi:hypothetical protein
VARAVRARRDPARLLRWYPPAWRARYGDELVALIEDELGGRSPGWRLRAAVAGAGLRERAHHAGLTGDTRPPMVRVRAWSLVVLGAWTPFVVAGASFQKLSEHYDAALPAAARALPTWAFDAVVVAAAIGALLVLVGALAVLPAFVRFLAGGGWSVVRRLARRATVVSTVAVVAFVGLLLWAHSLSDAQRNGGVWPYGAAFLSWALLTASALVLWTAAAVTVTRRLDLTAGVVAFEAALATGLAAVMVAITVATALWWAAIAAHAPWVLHGTAPGSAGSAFDPRLALTMAVMLAAALGAAWAVTRVARARGALRAA